MNNRWCILLASLLILASCNGEAQEVEVEQPITFNLQIAASSCFTTKAVKTGWNSGEQIQIWYDSNTQAEPDLMLQYDGSQWNVLEGAKAPLNSTGTIKALCYADNGMVLRSCRLPYSFTNRVLTSCIDHWSFMTRMQIVVEGAFSNTPESYSLSCSALSAPGEVTVSEDTITMTEFQGRPVRGKANADGLAFVFADNQGFDSDATYLFELISRPSDADSVSQNAIFQKEIADTRMSYLAITFPESKLSAPVDKGRTWGQDWVQLVANGPKFATTNLDGYYTFDEAVEACRKVGKGWRLADKSDMNFLGSGYSKTYVTQGEAPGCIITSTGGLYRGNQVFFPYCGSYVNDTFRDPSYGYYWLGGSTQTGKYCYGVFSFSRFELDSYSNKTFRLSVRPVYDN